MSTQPAIFFGHGSPMNAIETNAFTDAWAQIGRDLERPRAVLAISAHWYVPGTRVTVAERPKTIHDFGNFPKALFEVEYPAPGDPQLARRVAELLAPTPVALDTEWGLDHGTWSILVHVFPHADVPIVQLSIDETQPREFFLSLGAKLRPLREEGVLIAASGNVVHNLGLMFGSLRGRPLDDGGASLRFERYVRDNIEHRSYDALVHYEREGADAAIAVQDIDHYLPLLPVLGTDRGDEPISFPITGMPFPGMSMLSVRVG